MGMEIRKITNKVTDSLFKSPGTLLLLSETFKQLSDNAKNLLAPPGNYQIIANTKYSGEKYKWLKTVAPPSRILSNGDQESDIRSYLARTAPKVVAAITDTDNLNVPIYSFEAPIPLDYITVDDRILLSQMISISLGSMRRTDNHLSWYSLSLQQMLPSVNNVFNEMEQFIASILKAAEDAVKAIKDAINNVKRRIAQFQEIVVQIKQIIDALNITINFSALVIEGSGDNTDVVRAIQSATEKPNSLANSFPQGYYTGLVAMAVYPSGQSPKALDALISFLGS